MLQACETNLSIEPHCSDSTKGHASRCWLGSRSQGELPHRRGKRKAFEALTPRRISGRMLTSPTMEALEVVPGSANALHDAHAWPEGAPTRAGSDKLWLPAKLVQDGSLAAVASASAAVAPAQSPPCGFYNQFISDTA